MNSHSLTWVVLLMQCPHTPLTGFFPPFLLFSKLGLAFQTMISVENLKTIS